MIKIYYTVQELGAFSPKTSTSQNDARQSLIAILGTNGWAMLKLEMYPGDTDDTAVARFAHSHKQKQEDN